MRTAPGVGTRHDANKRGGGVRVGRQKATGKDREGCNILTSVPCSCQGTPNGLHVETRRGMASAGHAFDVMRSIPAQEHALEATACARVL